MSPVARVFLKKSHDQRRNRPRINVTARMNECFHRGAKGARIQSTAHPARFALFQALVELAQLQQRCVADP